MTPPKSDPSLPFSGMALEVTRQCTTNMQHNVQERSVESAGIDGTPDQTGKIQIDKIARFHKRHKHRWPIDWYD